MTGDGQVSVQYNELELPKLISGSTNITYEYSADGIKLKRQSALETRYYIDGIEYITNSIITTPAIDFIHTEDGLARNSGGNYDYEYFLKDNLGNTRVVYNSNGVVQQTDYMPYGLEINRYISGTKIKYLYNGIEKNDELGTYEAKFRDIDPVIGRWWQVDPAIESMESWSPYASNYDNPIRFIDPLGDEPDDFDIDPDPPGSGFWSGVRELGSGLGAMAVGTVVGTVDNVLGSDYRGALSGNFSKGSAASKGWDMGLNLADEGSVFVGTQIAGNGAAESLGGILLAPETGGVSLAGSLTGAAKVYVGARTAINAATNLVNQTGRVNATSSNSSSSSNAGKRRQNRIPDQGEPNSTATNKSRTTTKKYGPDGNVQKEFNKGHSKDSNPKGLKDHIHDYKPNPNNPTGRGTRRPPRTPKRNELKKDFGL